MKYPKLPDGPSPEGESGIRALERIDAPYLTQQNSDSTSFKQGQFRSVTVQAGAPYFWDNFIKGGAGVTALLDPEAGIDVRPLFSKAPFGHTPDVFATPYHAFVGDDYLLTYYRDNINAFNLSANYWPSLIKIQAPTPRVSSAGSTRGQSVDYFPDVNTTGLTQPLTSMTPFPCGFKDTSERFRFGVSFLEGASSAKQPKMYIGNTGTRSITAATVPLHAGRDMTFFTPFCVSRGKLQYIQYIKEKLLSTTLGIHNYDTQIDPALVTSTDFGTTWTETPLASLVPFLVQIDAAAASNNRNIYSNTQFDYMSFYGMSAYVGNNKVLIFIPNGMTRQIVSADPRVSEFCPMLFIADVGSVSLTRVAWPADAWPTNQGGWPLWGGTPTWEVGFRRLAQLHSAHFSFGAGCFYVPIIPQTLDAFATDIPNTVGWQIMYTRDYGATWTTSPTALPPAVANVGDCCPAGPIVRPYRSSTLKGRIIFSGVHPSTNAFELWATDGDFLTWKRIRSIAGADQSPDLVQGGDPLFDSAFYGVNYGNNIMPRSVFPAFPGQFDRP